MLKLGLALLALVSFNTLAPRPTTRDAAARAPLASASAADGAGRSNSPAASGAPAARFVVDASKSDFLVRAMAGGALWFKGHDHFVRPRDFAGEVTLTPGAVAPATLTMSVRSGSLEETRDVFTPQQKQIINKELREIVLQPDKYPEITFKSTDVRVENSAGGQFRVAVGGDLSLHGVTRHVVIPADVTMAGEELRARGEFEISRKDFGVPATSAFHGTVRIRDKLRVIFQIVARQA
ncbi:MAG: YceI family protein [Pyrinomonadaceae bacterium]